MLATDTKAPVVAETAVGADLLEALEVVTKLRVAPEDYSRQLLAYVLLYLSSAPLLSHPLASM